MTKTLTNSNVQQLTEQIADWHSEEVAVDVNRRLVRNVALAGRESKNGYRYTDKSLRNAVMLYESKPVFLDHAVNQTRVHQRSTRDLVGSVTNPRFKNGRIRGDIQTLDTEAGRTFIALAGTTSPAVGMSHVVLAERSADRSLVEKIHEVVSIDAVIFPATTSTFSESIQGFPVVVPGSVETVLAEIDLRIQGHLHRLTGDSTPVVSRAGLFSDQLVIAIQPTEENSVSAVTSTEFYALDWSLENGIVVLGEELTPLPADQLQENRFTPFQQANPQPEAYKQRQEKLERAIQDRNEVLKQVEKLIKERHAAKKEQEVDQLLAASRLPQSSIDKEFRQQLLNKRDRTSRMKLIQERHQLINRLTATQPNSLERSEQQATDYSDEFIVNQLRGQSLSVLGK